jgi:hypothetical protein
MGALHTSWRCCKRIFEGTCFRGNMRPCFPMLPQHLPQILFFLFRETSLLCLSAVDSESGHVVGFLCLWVRIRPTTKLNAQVSLLLFSSLWYILNGMHRLILVPVHEHGYPIQRMFCFCQEWWGLNPVWLSQYGCSTLVEWAALIPSYGQGIHYCGCSATWSWSWGISSIAKGSLPSSVLNKEDCIGNW